MVTAVDVFAGTFAAPIRTEETAINAAAKPALEYLITMLTS